MSKLFRLSGAVRRDPRIDVWLAEQDEAFGRIARTMFNRLRGCGPDVRGIFHDGGAVACVGDAAFAYVNIFKAHVNLGFFRGATLHDPAGLLQGSGKRMRHVKLSTARDLDATALNDLIAAAYADIRNPSAADD